MQTFLPYTDFAGSAACLDRQRLGKQRVESFQILRALRGESKGWTNHPATQMWRGFESALEQYMRCCIVEWVRRGYKNNMLVPAESWSFENPWWLGEPAFHASHRSNLIRKMPEHYGTFGWDQNPNIPYWWPSEHEGERL